MTLLPTNAKGHLLVAGRDVVELAATYGTPLFVYDIDQVRASVDGYRSAFESHAVPRVVRAGLAHGNDGAGWASDRGSRPRYQIAYASKALSIKAIYEVMMQERNVSVDVVSGGELFTALQAGVSPHKIHFHGNNKNEEELRYALASGVGCFVVDSFHEIDLLQRLTQEEEIAGSSSSSPSPPDAESGGRVGRGVRVLLRVSPGVTAHTHEYNTTGQVDSKFGFDVTSGQARLAYERLSCKPTEPEPEPAPRRLRVVGLHCHIGSQIFSTEGYVLACRRLLELAYEWGMLIPASPDDAERAEEEDMEGRQFVLNVGGGYGIAYTAEDAPLPSKAFVDVLLDTVTAFLAEKAASLDEKEKLSPGTHGFCFPDIWIEPGRSLVGAAGTTLYTVGARKTIPALPKHYVAVDGGMSDNIRPVLYQAKYTAYIGNRMSEHHRFMQLGPAEQVAELERNTAAQTGDEGGARTGQAAGGMLVATVVGKLCETGDQLVRDCPLPCATRSGDIMAVLCTGAYGYAMCSNYNRMRRPAILFIEGSGSGEGGEVRERVVLRRETYEDLVRNDVSFLHL